jgi:hypothetical protein
MKKQLNAILFLGMAFLLAVYGLTVALTEPAIAGPLCPNCVCDPLPCGIAVSPTVACVSTGTYCDGSPGNPSTCGQYCTNTR